MTKNSLFLSIGLMGALCNSMIVPLEKTSLAFHETRLKELELEFKSIKNNAEWNVFFATLCSAFAIGNCVNSHANGAIIWTMLAVLNVYFLDKRNDEKRNVTEEINKLKAFLYAQKTE